MSFRLVATPIATSIEPVVPRAEALDPRLLDAFVPAPGIERALDRLREPDALVVTTGQQPGLFTGPLYTIHKALSAAALARVLERRWDRPVVPVFWVAADDHDFAEASRASWLNGDGQVVTGALPPRPAESPSTPLYREPLGPAIEPVLAELAASLPTAEFTSATIAWLEGHFRRDATVAGSFAGALAELLAPAGIVCLSSAHPCVKRASAAHLLRSLELARELTDDLSAHARELAAMGRDAGVPVGDGATLVMLEGALGRDRLLVDGDGFLTRRSHERFDLRTIRHLAMEAPERLSPNVLLRPVVESSLLPTVAYVAGPAEMRYLELSRPIYDRLGVTRQVPVPRWSGIVVERRVDRVLEKFGIALEDLLAPAGPLEARLVREQLSPDTTAALTALRATIESKYEMIARAATDIDPTLLQPVQRTRGQALNGLDDLEKKLVHHLKRRQETELTQIVKARTAVFPNDKPQERVLSIVSFLARYGPSLIPSLGEEFERWYAEAFAYGLEGRPVPA